jgi:hypothetical protein
MVFFLTVCNAGDQTQGLSHVRHTTSLSLFFWGEEYWGLNPG